MEYGRQMPLALSVPYRLPGLPFFPSRDRNIVIPPCCKLYVCTLLCWYRSEGLPQSRVGRHPFGSEGHMYKVSAPRVETRREWPLCDAKTPRCESACCRLVPGKTVKGPIIQVETKG